MGPHHYHMDPDGTAALRDAGKPGMVLVGCDAGEECDGANRCLALVGMYRSSTGSWIREGID